MKSEEYKKQLLQAIQEKSDSLDMFDATGHIKWGSDFKEFVENFKPVEKIEPIDFEGLLELINKTFERDFRVVSSNVKSKYRARLRDGYTKEDIFRAIMVCKEHDFHVESDFQYCTPTFFSQEKTLEKYGTRKDRKDEDKVSDNTPVN